MKVALNEKNALRGFYGQRMLLWNPCVRRIIRAGSRAHAGLAAGTTAARHSIYVPWEPTRRVGCRI